MCYTFDARIHAPWSSVIYLLPQVVLKKMFGPDVGDQGLADMLHKIESLFQER